MKLRITKYRCSQDSFQGTDIMRLTLSTIRLSHFTSNHDLQAMGWFQGELTNVQRRMDVSMCVECKTNDGTTRFAIKFQSHHKLQTHENNSLPSLHWYEFHYSREKCFKRRSTKDFCQYLVIRGFRPGYTWSEVIIRQFCIYTITMLLKPNLTSAGARD